MAKSTPADRLKAAKDRVAKLEADARRQAEIKSHKDALAKLKRPAKAK